MKNKIIAFVGVFLVLVVALVVPISAVVPAGVSSYVNFFDYSAVDGELADVYGYDEANDVITLIGTAEFEYSDYIDGFYVTCDYIEYETYSWIYFVFSNTLFDVAPYLDPLSYEMGIYVGSAGSDSINEVRMGGFSNDQFNWLFDSYSNQYTFDDIMGDFFCIAAATYDQYDFIEFYYPMIFASTTHEYDYVDTTMWSGEVSRFYTVFNEDYFLSGDDDGSYDDGYNVGYDEGFNQGLQEFAGAIKGPSTTIFNTASYSIFLEAPETTEDTYTGNISPTIFNSSVFFDRSVIPNDLSFIPEVGYIDITWTTDKQWVWGSYSLNCSGVTDGVVIYDGFRNRQYYTEWYDYEYVDIYGIYPLTLSPEQSILYPVHVSQIRIYFFASDLYTGLSLISDSASYNKGYDSGFADGLIANGEVAYNEGLRTGYNDGYLQGKAEGLELAKDGSFYSLITAIIDAPVNAFTSLLDFEVLGINMNKVVGALFVTVLFIILCKYALRA